MNISGNCLQFDIGNSSAKWRLIRAGRVVARGKYVATDPSSWRELVAAVAAPEQIWIASVASAEAESTFERRLYDHWGVRPWFARTQPRTGDLINSYAEPQRMGVDRWLAMLAGRQRAAGSLCVVDAGSALTIDLVSAAGRHEGGYIIPGPALMERALLLDTDRVRFAEDIDYSLLPGTSTAEAVRHGVALAQAGAVTLALKRCRETPQLVFSGGAGEVLMRLLDKGGEFAPDLVFEGLEVMAALRC